MNKTLLPLLEKSSLNARNWLKQTVPPTAETIALKELGLLFCQDISNRTVSLLGTKNHPFCLPSHTTFIDLNRDDLLALAQVISLSDPAAWQVKTSERVTWAKIFGGIALFYARENDLYSTAALVRAAVHLRLWHVYLAEATDYLVDQQQLDGRFGLLTQEITSVHDADPDDSVQIQEAIMRLTVEVLWTLVEVTFHLAEEDK